ncbi:MAG: 2OG-Fe(II) oxygenase, partial [Myxococcales bacterium]|nr:2OG-Fe(II) oxygenase [Myxococcales bacterium]
MSLAAPGFFFEPDAFEAHARAHAGRFAEATPFPHAVIDQLLDPALADALADAFPTPAHPHWKRVDHPEQAARLGHLQRSGFEGVSPLLRHTLAELNGAEFLGFLERLTGLRGLVPDPAFRAAGLHMTLPGGHLDLHADFNRDRFRDLSRVLTVLVYLNPGWDDAWGGALELWPPDLTECAARIAPTHNRCVVLQNGDTGYHGHPSPLRCPPDRARQSLAAYYYLSDAARAQQDPTYQP